MTTLLNQSHKPLKASVGVTNRQLAPLLIEMIVAEDAL